MSDVFDFGTPLTNVKSAMGGSKSNKWKNPPSGGYELRCVESKISKSKNGFPQWEMGFDIGSGEFKGSFKNYPKKTWQNLSSEVGKGYAKAILECFVADNEGLISPEILTGTQLDPSVVLGLRIGGILVRGKNPKFLDIDTLCRVDVALKASPAEVPKTADNNKTKEDDLPF